MLARVADLDPRQVPRSSLARNGRTLHQRARRVFRRHAAEVRKERLCRDPAMRWVVGNRAITGYAASASQMGRFEKKWYQRKSGECQSLSFSRRIMRRFFYT
jgi:hypothetical protein